MYEGVLTGKGLPTADLLQEQKLQDMVFLYLTEELLKDEWNRHRRQDSCCFRFR